MKANEYCKGCHTSLLCFYRKLNKGECPCTNCIVKVICNDQKDFDECNVWHKAAKKVAGKIEESRWEMKIND